MNRDFKRCGIVALSLFSFGSLLTSIKPRIVAYNQASSANTIAHQRAASCIPLNYVKANQIPIDYASKQPLEPSTLVCDWDGRTGQINGRHAINYVRQGQAKTITETLINRGFKPQRIVKTNP
jgi:hypothetical protein